jgi:hypothetical protein
MKFADELKRCIDEGDVLGGTFVDEVIANVSLKGIKVGVLNFHRCVISNMSMENVTILWNASFTGCVVRNFEAKDVSAT